MVSVSTSAQTLKALHTDPAAFYHDGSDAVKSTFFCKNWVVALLSGVGPCIHSC